MSFARPDDLENANGITIFVAGSDKIVRVVKAANTVKPGMIVKLDGGEFVPDDNSGKHSGWAPEHVSEPGTASPENLLADFTAGQRICAYRNPGDVFMALCDSGANFVAGDLLKTNPADAGKLIKWVAGADGPEEIVAVARKGTTDADGVAGALAADTRLPVVYGRVS